MIDTFFDRLTRGIEVALALAFMLAVCMNFANVVGRYVFGVTLGWADEAQVFIMIWMAFLGAVVASWRGIHLRMDMLYRIFPRALRVALRLAELVLLVAAAGLVVGESFTYATTMFKLERVSDVGGIPMWIPHSGVALGFALIAVIALVQLWEVARTRDENAGRQEGAP